MNRHEGTKARRHEGAASPRLRALVPVCWILAALLPGCEIGGRGSHGADSARFYPPQPQVPRVIALGTLHGAAPLSQTQVDLALFLFGAEPPPPLTIANPTGLAARDTTVLICDNALNTIFRWDATADRVVEEVFDPPLEHPFAVDILPGGDRLICDRGGVRRVDAAGRQRCRYTFDGGEFRAGGVLAVAETVWVTNLARHTIEVFDLASGHYLRTIGAHGDAALQFKLPRSLARTPDGNVCVVDLLNYRVQILTPDGQWIRTLGQHGDSPGTFARPKDLAVGPDGTIFVTDAFAQRVHAFSPDGTPLLTFGEPQSGGGELTLPSGIAVSQRAPRTALKLPPDAQPAYYVLVSEQLNEPGIRVYAWLGTQAPALRAPSSAPASNWKPRSSATAAINPHWDPARCTKCHQTAGERLLPIALAESDRLCLSCHDGAQAPADPHPIGRPITSDLVSVPDGFPDIHGTIGCLTCHDIERHCDPAVRRPEINAKLLRGYDPQRTLEYCGTCHRTEIGERFSPHRQRDASGRVREDACLFCHTRRPEVTADGQRKFEPHLRTATSQLCLNCHTRHWDLSPQGHVDRPVTPRIREWMLTRELRRTHDSPLVDLAKMVSASQREPARLPLGDGQVTCYSCHNPHYAGLFPEDSELGTLATRPEERRSALRANWIDLCSECHHR